MLFMEEDGEAITDEILLLMLHELDYSLFPQWHILLTLDMANTDLQTALTSIRKFSTEEEAKLLKDFLDKQA